MSKLLAQTTHKSNTFQLFLKYDKPNANSFKMHSKVNTPVNTRLIVSRT